MKRRRSQVTLCYLAAACVFTGSSRGVHQVAPLSRPLFVYAKWSSFRRPVVQGFIRYMIQNEKRIARVARFVSLTPRQLRKARLQYNRALRVARGE